MKRARTLPALALLVLLGLVALLWIMIWPSSDSSLLSDALRVKVPMTKGGLPAPVALGAPQGAQVFDAAAAVAAAYMTPVNLYGKVVDQNGVPVEGATASVSVLDKPLATGSEHTVTSDAEGMFSLTGEHGAAASVKVSKSGYYATENARRMIRFGMFRSDQDPEIPTASNPAIFVLRKRGQTVPLVEARKNVSVARNGTPIEVDLRTGRTTSLGAGDVKVEAWTSDDDGYASQPYDWRCRISVPGGGLIERRGAFVFEAPTGGYRAFDEILMPKTAERWSTQAERQYFVKLADDHYALVTFKMIAGGDHFFKLQSYLNPVAGDRNLEGDKFGEAP